ncbi:MAG: hypothetical protein RBG13Loki_4176 [Promethearchaeota archaeon CR_4]|nr:MAG: hypothetical protein RBG13Loki_4176 [Candidatus Lokiarchaeota archaeon CR_4]
MELARYIGANYQPEEGLSPQPESENLASKEPPIKITRGFQVSNGCIEFFVRIDNNSEHGLFDVAVELELPEAFELLSPKTVIAGNISPHYHEAVTFLFTCHQCTTNDINAAVKYKDHQNKFHIQQMPEYKIESCKYIMPQDLSRAEFEAKFDKAPQKAWDVRLKEGTSQEEVFRRIQEQLHMSTVTASGNQIELAGRSKDGRDVLYKGVVKNSEGGMYLSSLTVSELERITIGIACEIGNSLKDKIEQVSLKQTQLLQKQDQALGKLDDIPALLEQYGPKIEEAIAKFDDMETYLRDHLASDWEKIRGAWTEAKNGEISKKEFAKRAITTLGWKVIKVVMGRFH